MIIVCTADKKYFPLLKIMVNSVRINSPGTKIFARLVNWAENISDTEIDELKQSYEGHVDVLLDPNEQLEEPHWDHSCGLVSKFLNRERSRYKNKKESAFKAYNQIYSDLGAYCTNIKFNTISMLLDERDEPILYLDVDTIIRKPLDGLERIIKQTDIAMVGFDKGGLIGVNCTGLSRMYIHEVEKCMDMFNISGDEVALKKAYDIFHPSITYLTTTFKDEGVNGFNHDSVMWSGHGDVKCYDEQYIEEQKKYENGSNNTS